jgi:hypothetical protein
VRFQLKRKEQFMSDKQAAQGSAATARKPFKQMTRREKTIFIAKLAISILSFGMIFPNLMQD